MEAAAADGGGAVRPGRRLRQRPAAERAAYTAAAAHGDSSSSDKHDSGGSESDCSALDNMPNVPEQGSSDDGDMSEEEEEEGQEEAGAAPGRGMAGAQQQAGTSNTQHSKRRRTSSNDGSSQVPKRQKTSSAAAKQAGNIYTHTVVVLAGGNRQVHMAKKITARGRGSRFASSIHVPRSLVAACFPDLPCEVNLELTVDGQAADLQAPVTALLKLAESKRSDGRISSQVQCTGMAGVLRSYLGHIITRMAANINGQQLTLHLQSPAAVQAAAVAAAAEAATTGWHVHDYKGGEKKIIGTSAGSRKVFIPAKLFSSAFPGPPPLPFKVQLAVYKDGYLVGGPADVTVSSCRGNVVKIPVTLAPQVSGCEVHQLKASAPNLLQVHVESSEGQGASAQADVGVAAAAAAPATGRAGMASGDAGIEAAAAVSGRGSAMQASTPAAAAAAAAAAATLPGPDSQAGQQQQQQAQKKRQCSAAAKAAGAPAALHGVGGPVAAGSAPGVLGAAYAAAAAAGVVADGTVGGRRQGTVAHTAACAQAFASALPATAAETDTLQQQSVQQQQQQGAVAIHPRVWFADMSESEVTADDAGGDAGRQQLQDTATQPEQHQWQQQQVALIASQEQKQGSSYPAAGAQCGLNNLVTPTAAPGTEAPTHAVAVAVLHAHAATAEQPAPVKTEQAAADSKCQIGLSHSNTGMVAAAAVAGEAGGVLPLPAASRGLQGFSMRPASADPVPLHEAWVQLLGLLDHLQAPKQQLKRLQAAMQLLDSLPDDDRRLARFNAHYATVLLWVKRQDVEEVWEAVGVLLDRALA